MKVPLSWLTDYVAIQESPTEIARLMEHAGIGVESLDEREGDWIFDLEITPNRPDWLSIFGVARELAAFLNRPVKEPDWPVTADGGCINDLISVQVDEPELCLRYSACIVDGVPVGESPNWMKRRLEACGVRPICNIVDITNYVLLELGQPLHAFDYDALKGKQIIVRRAREGEKIWTLDQQERLLDDQVLVIADAERPVAIAGVIGGLETAISPFTRRVLIESAQFHPISIRRTSRRLGIVTESSYRFERWVDPDGTARGAQRAAALMTRLAGGRVIGGVIDVYPAPLHAREVSLRPDRVRRLLGVDIPSDELLQLLNRLGLKAQSDSGRIGVSVPTFRADIAREVDLIEEIARIYGYDRIPSRLPEGAVSGRGDSVRRIQEQKVKEFLCRLGLREVITYSLTHPDTESGWGVDREEGSLSLVNPLTQDYTVLRVSLIPSLLQVLSHNIRMGVRDVWVFELGRRYRSGRVGVMEETEPRLLSIALTGSCWGRAWNLPPQTGRADFYTLKGIVEHLLSWLSIDRVRFRSGGPAFLHPYRSARLDVGDASIGFLGQLHPAVAQRNDIPSDIFIAELDFEAIASLACWQRISRPIPSTPSIRRDIAVVLPEELPSATVADLIRREAGDLLEEVWVFDEFRGASIPNGYRSVAYALILRAPDRTLTQQEADQIVQRIKEQIRNQMGLQIRG